MIGVGEVVLFFESCSTHLATNSAIKCHLLGGLTGKCFSPCTKAPASTKDILTWSGILGGYISGSGQRESFTI